VTVTPDHLPLTGGEVLITGRDLGANADVIRVSCEGADLTFDVEVVEPHTTIRCRVPAAPGTVVTGTAYPLRVVVDGVAAAASSHALTFSALVQSTR
jgi:hypothetical protein